jgi:hypothetical protein
MSSVLAHLDEVPCIILAHLTPAQRRAYVLGERVLERRGGSRIALPVERHAGGHTLPAVKQNH